jgi:uncharacterized protein with PIN domain
LPAESLFVLDACAVVAFLEDEPGAEIVEALLLDGDHRCVIHGINACEVYYDLYRRTGEERANKLAKVLADHGVAVEESLSAGLWQAAGKIKAEWRRVSLADCVALALAIRDGGTLVTSDHHELDRIAQAQVCAIRFIR